MTGNALADKLAAILTAAQKQGYSPAQAHELVKDELKRHSKGDVVLAEAALANAVKRHG